MFRILVLGVGALFFLRGGQCLLGDLGRTAWVTTRGPYIEFTQMS